MQDTPSSVPPYDPSLADPLDPNFDSEELASEINGSESIHPEEENPLLDAFEDMRPPLDEQIIDDRTAVSELLGSPVEIREGDFDNKDPLDEGALNKYFFDEELRDEGGLYEGDSDEEYQDGEGVKH